MKHLLAFLSFRPLRYLLRVCICVYLLHWSIVDARADLKLKPGISLRQEYNDNLLLKTESEKSDLISTLNPFIRGGFDSRYLQAKGDLGLKFLFYQKNDERNESDFEDVPRVTLTGSFLPESDFTIGFSEVLTRETLDERNPYTDENDFLNKTRVNRFSINPQYRVGAFRTLAPTFGYRFDRVDYDEAAGDDYQRHSFSGELAKDVYADKLRLILGGEAAYHEADASTDYRLRSGYGAVILKLTPDLLLSGQFGRTGINFEQGREVLGRTGKASVAYAFSSKLKATAEYGESFIPSATRGTLKKESLEGSLVFSDYIDWSLRVFDSEGRYLEADSRDQERGAKLSVRLPLHKRLDLQPAGGYSRLHYQPSGETATRVDVGCSLAWKLNQMEVDLGYLWRRNDSSIGARDYENNLVHAGLTWLF